MTTFIIISLASVVLYGSGLMRWWLNKCRLYGPQPAQPEPLTASEDPEEPKQEPTPEPVKLETLERLQAENKAIIILKSKGIKEPLNLVKMYNDLELLEIIKEQ